MRPLGVCLIGTGYMGKCHALAWNAVSSTFGDVARPTLELLVERDDALAASRARQLGFSRSTSDWRSAIADPAIDVVSITTPTGLHADMAIEALNAGKHVWCEKPMAKTVDSSRRMAAAAEQSQSRAVLGYNYIQSPSFRIILDAVQQGRIGEIHHIRVEMDEDFMADPASPLYQIYSNPNAGSNFQEFAVHPLSLITMIAGDIDEVFGADWKGSGGDHANAFLKFRKGISAMVAISRSAWGRKGRIGLQLYGSEGTILFDQERFNEVQFYSTKIDKSFQGFTNILSGPDHPPYDAFIPSPGHGLGFNDLKTIECHELIRAISGDAAHVIDFATGLKIEEAIAAIGTSAEERRWLKI
jgi:predicted dehydrogenase